MTDSNLILDVSAERLQEVLQSAGYRVTVSEQNGMVQLLSASQGVGFAARMGNPALPEGQFLDYTLSCALRVQGELPAGLAERWNVEKRFARLTVQGAFLVLELDVIVAGGVSELSARHHRTVGPPAAEFLLFLRANAAPGAGEKPASPRNRCPRRRPNPRRADDALRPAGARPGRRPRSRIRSVSAARRERCQLRQTMNSILKQPTKVRIAAAVLLVAGAAGAVALMRGSPPRAAKASRAASRRQAGGGRRAAAGQTAGRGHAGRGAGGSGRAAAPAAGAAAGARSSRTIARAWINGCAPGSPRRP